MTAEMMSLQALLEKSSDTDLLREMIGFAAQRLMELEVGELTGAAYGEKDPERLAQRNGYRSRDWQTCRASTILAGGDNHFGRSAVIESCQLRLAGPGIASDVAGASGPSGWLSC